MATGSMFMHSSNASILLHCKPLPNQFAKVIIETILVESSPLPCPIGEASTVKEAVVPSMKSKNSALDISKHDICRSQPVDKPPIQSSLRSLKKMAKLLPLLDSKRIIASIPMPKTILGYAHEVSIWKTDIKRWLLKKRIESSHVSTYMKYLFETKCPKSLDMVGFLCPQWTCSSQENGLGKNKRAGYICTSMGHTMFNAELKESKVQKNTQWLLIECPRQPNAIDCGYYILRYMREIITQRTLTIPIKYFASSPSPYTSNQLDEIREEWVVISST
ncbi:hypothetical protein V2J09_017825 [Rumex salicifolius]